MIFRVSRAARQSGIQAVRQSGSQAVRQSIASMTSVTSSASIDLISLN